MSEGSETNKPVVSFEDNRFIAVQDYIHATLVEEIAEIEDDEITPDTATYIAGQMLSGEIQFAYLEAHSAMNESEKNSMDASRKATGEYQDIFTRAQNGEGIALKGFVLKREKEHRSIAKNSDTSVEERQLDERIADKLHLIGETIPEQVNGTLMRALPPVWQKKPEPLLEQLKAIKTGGER